MPPNIKTTNSLLNFAIPTEIVDLPSKGKFYPQGSPLFQKESIEIRFMTAKDEDILTSPTLLKKGVAIDRLLQSVIVDENINAKDLLVGDRNALMYAVRITGYGANYQAEVVCPECGGDNDVTFNLSKYTEGYVETVDTDDVTVNPDGTFSVDLPTTKINVQVKFLTGHDEQRLTKSSEMKLKNNLPDSQLTDLLKSIVVSANGVTDPGELGQFLEMMPASDSRFLRNLYVENSPNVKLTQEFTCQHCGSESEVEVPITTGFFWPEQ
tara:strand:+ start:7056 stop:7856 length:801 start_codon:yes stop_codon:yes gene_type:complete